MAKGTIDLRKSIIPAEAKEKTQQEVVRDENEIEWTGYEHEYRVRGPYWFLYPLAIATVGIVFGIVTKNYSFIVFLVMAFTILVVYIKRPPRVITYRIEKKGVWMQNNFYDFSKLKSFWIFEHPLLVSELLLETDKTLNPLLRFRLENVVLSEVKKVISRYLPEKEQKDLASDQIARIIGF